VICVFLAFQFPSQPHMHC
jgi:hypothetical protein